MKPKVDMEATMLKLNKKVNDLRAERLGKKIAIDFFATYFFVVKISQYESFAVDIFVIRNFCDSTFRV